MLEARELRVSYGAAPALWDVSLRIEAGELVCVVGPNGAGKTTLINAIAGLIRVASGSLTIDGRNLVRLPAHRFCDCGIAIVPEGRRLFTGMTVRENLELGSYRKAARAERQASLERVFAIFPVLRERLDAPAGALSGGQQQMLAIGRALMSRPRLLILDEPSLGLAPIMVKAIFDAVGRINAEGTTVLLVEQNLVQSLRLSHRAYVLETGRIVLAGTGEELLANPHTRKAFLGLS